MDCRVVCLILFGLGVGLAREASAQAGTRTPPRGKREKTARAAPAPAAPTGLMPLLPRFWQLADSAERTDAAEVFNQYFRHFITYPALALQAGVGGAIYCLLTVLPDGRVGGISTTRRDLTTSSPPIKAVLALDAELQRVAWQLRFKSFTPLADSTDNTDITDLTDRTISTDSTDVTDVTDIARTRIRADTVTISYRFVLP